MAANVGEANGAGVGWVSVRSGVVVEGAAATGADRVGVAVGGGATCRVEVVRLAGSRVSAGVLSVRGGGGLTTGIVAGGSAGRVRVPGRLKFCSSRGPTASVAGVLVVAGSVVFWASAADAGIAIPNASNIVVKRNPALISSRSVLERRLLCRAARAVHARRYSLIQAQAG